MNTPSRQTSTGTPRRLLPISAPAAADGQSPAHTRLAELLRRVAAGQVSPDTAMKSLHTLPFEDLGFARLDHHRALRKDFPEVVFCAGKTVQQAAQIIARLAANHPRVLATHASQEQFHAARRLVPALRYHELARAIYLDRLPRAPRCPGVAIVAAGTSDLPVAEEARLTAHLMGHEAFTVYDAGVAGLHRLIPHLEALRDANVVIAVAGMEGALPSVLGGLLAAPIIAVPTSVGYGASFHGLAALLAMLNSCASGLAVVNIDNGFGAGYLAATINRRCVPADPTAMSHHPRAEGASPRAGGNSRHEPRS